MELEAAGALMNTAVAEAKDSLRMAKAMKLAVEAGWLDAHAGFVGADCVVGVDAAPVRVDSQPCLG